MSRTLPVDTEDFRVEIGDDRIAEVILGAPGTMPTTEVSVTKRTVLNIGVTVTNRTLRNTSVTHRTLPGVTVTSHTATNTGVRAIGCTATNNGDGTRAHAVATSTAVDVTPATFRSTLPGTVRASR